ncbi:hypothetical protein BDM02DRAFT_3267810 [Thelephora ganbajun]|uniref:Uncharacterized protein n=1 Tax=Thelephora ganbajun TaxID=370292 RepID=A0ACB6ZM78_THEGA|nr:hypothetical protein BDM02DRAFT_3267810 [Thelephora ganbajun]
MAYYHQRQGYRNNHWQKSNNRERTLTQDSSTSSLASTSSSHHHHQSSGRNSQNWSESNGTSFQQSSPKMGQEFQQTPAPNLSSGQKDLEILEKLKESIMTNQHEFFRSTPQPTALAKIYMGNTSISPVPPHPEQIPTAQNTSRKDDSIDDNQRRGRASSIDSWESRKQNGYHHAQSERYEPCSNGHTDSKPLHSSGTISPSKSTNDLRDSFKSSAPSRASSRRGSFSRSSFQPSAFASTRSDNQSHDSTMRARSLSNARSMTDFGGDRQRQQKPYSEDRQPRSDADITTPSQSLQRSTTLTDLERSSDKGPFDAGREPGDDSGDGSPERDNRRHDRLNRRADERPRIIDNRRNLPDQRHGDNNRQYDNSRPGSIAPTVDRQSDDRTSRYDERSTTARSTDHQQSPAQDGGDDRRMPPPPVSPIVTDTRHPPSIPPSTHAERTNRTSAADSTPLLPSDAIAVRNVDDRTARQSTLNTKDERKTLEERLTRQPPLSLQERISMPAGSETRSASGTPRPAPPLEERLSYPSDRGSRSGPTSPTVARSSIGSLNQDDRHLSTGGSRPTPDERGRYPPASEHVDDRKPPVRSSMPPPNTSENPRAPSFARDDYASRGTNVRDYRRGGAVGSTTREPNEARGPDRFDIDRMDLDRYDERIPRDPYMRDSSGIPPGPDVRDRERGVWDRPRWPDPSRNDPYNDDPQYRQGGPASYPHGHSRYQDYNDRPPRWEDKDRQWDQSGPWSDRERRFIERDSAPGSGTASAWETREEREVRELRERNARGRSAYPPPPPPGPDRGYDSRAALTSKISPQRYSPAPAEGRYPPGRDTDPPAIYSQPPIPASSGPNSSVSNNAPGYPSRVRPRSPSPMSISRDSSRPPIKRQREDFAPGPGASSDYYSPHTPGEANPNGPIGSGSDYPPPLSSRMSAGPTPPSSGPPSGYYGHSSGVNTNRGPRDYHQGPRDGYPPGPPPPSQGYDRMPPPRGYNQNHHQRGNYARDDRRYGGPPPRG